MKSKAFVIYLHKFHLQSQHKVGLHQLGILIE